MHRNEVTLVGRLSRPPRGKELPSGDLMTMWGLAVRRPSEHPSGKKADGIACVTFDPEVGARVAEWRVDDVVSVQGALHQRFWGGPGVGTSTYEVEVHHASLLEHGRLSLSAGKTTKQPRKIAKRTGKSTEQNPMTGLSSMGEPDPTADEPVERVPEQGEQARALPRAG
jgi:single-stranded DNA-binding protein